MRWRSRLIPFDHAWVRWFAWYPVRCMDGHTRWFCQVARVMRYHGSAPAFVYRKYKGK